MNKFERVIILAGRVYFPEKSLSNILSLMEDIEYDSRSDRFLADLCSKLQSELNAREVDKEERAAKNLKEALMENIRRFGEKGDTDD